MDYGTRAKENFLNGYNCCQAVFLACTDELGLDTETRAKIASSFGGGMGGMRQVCGAVSGMLMALGLHQGYKDPKDRRAKRRSMRSFARWQTNSSARTAQSSAGSFWGWMRISSPSRPRNGPRRITKSARAVSSAGMRQKSSKLT